MISTGTQSRYAFATAVTTSVTPGPAVTIATPTRPVVRAQPSAAWPAACSWRVSTSFSPRSIADWKMASRWPPCSVNTRSTPAACSIRTRISPPSIVSMASLLGPSRPGDGWFDSNHRSAAIPVPNGLESPGSSTPAG